MRNILIILYALRLSLHHTRKKTEVNGERKCTIQTNARETAAD